MVHRAAEAALLRDGQRADGLEQVAVGNLAVIKRGRCAGRPEKTAKRGQAKLGAAVFRAEAGGNEPDDLPEVGVLCAAKALRHAMDAGERVIAEVRLFGFRGRFPLAFRRVVLDRYMEQVAVFGNEQEDKPVNDTEKLLVEGVRQFDERCGENP
jgi:hypothetical protein